MNCRDAVAAMLGADLDELAGDARTPLAGHVQACPACAKAAARIIDQTSVMREAIAAVVNLAEPVTPLMPPTHFAGLDRRNARRANPQRPRWRGVLGTGIAIAAATAGVIVLGADSSNRRIDLYVPPAQVPARPIVNASGSSGVAVIETPDPTITVIWTY